MNRLVSVAVQALSSGSAARFLNVKLWFYPLLLLMSWLSPSSFMVTPITAIW